MRHRIYGKHLGRNKDQRQSLFKGLVYSLLSYGTIQTSEAKAKAIKGLVDQMINLAKKNPRAIEKNLQERLVKELVPKLKDRTSGYTSLVRMGTRPGDQTMMVKMSLIGAEELKPMEKAVSKKITEKKENEIKVSTEKKVSSKQSAKTAAPKRRIATKSAK